MKKRTESVLRNILISIGKPFYLLLVSLLYVGQLILHILSLPGQLILKIFYFIGRIKLPEVKITLSSPEPVHKKLKKIPKRRSKFRSRTGVVGFLLGSLTAGVIIYLLIFNILLNLPSPNKLLTRDQTLTTKIFDRNNKLLYKIYRDKDRTAIKIDDLPNFVINSTIAIEDKDFYQHQGLSLTGIVRALYQNLFENQKSGGSTITQQLIKNALLSNEKTLQRKLKEAVLALLVEKKYSKKEILEMYLNEVGYGGASYGIEEASQKYFAKHASDLNLAEAALLAGLPASPTQFSPFGNNPSLAKQRQALVLKNMVENKMITEGQSQKARAEKLDFASPGNEILAPHFVMYVKELLVAKYGEKMVEEGGLEVKTSLDYSLQEETQKIVKEEVENLLHYRISNGAVLATNPQTGEILAMVGSKDYFSDDIDGNYNVTTALRQPGSSIKPVTYSIALENGFTPASLLEDSPVTYQVPGQPPYSPTNYDHIYHGKVPLRIALGSSYNVPAVKILAAFGVKKMIQRGKEMGITTWDNPSRFGLSLTLGGGEVKMTDMTVVYGVLANNGIRVDINPFLEIKNSKGKILEENLTGKQSPVLSPGIAYLLTSILSDNSARTPAFGPSSQLNYANRTVAVKTGTTQNMRDNWTIGYTPSRLVAAWVGNNDNTPMSYVASGVTGASPIWRKIMDQLLFNQPIEYFPIPDDVKEVYICSLTGTLSCDGCPTVRKEYFLSGSEPKFNCSPEKIEEILKNIKPTLNPQIL